ncbi:ABC transporter permease, partial [Ideonella sp.]|uniref:ABC transporter permease n=1 Tax=Ideonella sp. TaxID=1929293 RepID=UPI003BB72FC2
MKAAWTVFCKELLDALRDRRTLLMVLLSSVAMGPLVLVLISSLVSGMEKRAEARELMVQGIEHAPSLRNYLERQTYTLTVAPPDYAEQLERSKLADPVLVIGADFEAELARGESPLLELVSASANQRAESATGRLVQLLQGYNREQASMRLAVRGVSGSVLQAVQIEERDLSNPASRSARLTGMLPFFVLMAVLYGALNAALDSTAGERERGSLEPLLMNPASRLSLVVGKWGAVAAVGMLIAVLSCVSFLPGQWLLRSETLAALFQYGWGEALAFLGLLLPLAAALAALLMAIAIRCKTVKEAQANATGVVMAVSMLPLLSLFNQEGEQAWHLWVPAMAQSALMNRVLKGEAIAPLDFLIPALASAV